MAYDPDEHGRLESLYLKYGALLQSEARSIREQGRPDFAGHDLAEQYENALATAHAVYAYLLAHPVARQAERRRESHAEAERPRYSAPAI
jgi:hypothetical protein